jgi:hypothetical protein
MLCECDNIPRGQGIVYESPQPSHQEKLEKLTHFGATVVEKSYGHFAGHDIVRDLLKSKFIQVLQKNEKRLKEMVMEYTKKEKELLRKLRIEEHELATVCQEAYSKFIDFDWVEMTSIEYVLLNNAFQISDPRKYPLHDKELKAIFDAITIGNQAIAHCPDIPKTLLASLSHQ